MLLPCILCELEIDNHECCQNGTKLDRTHFQSLSDLREHLIEVHSKYVSRALLAPNVTNKAHFWLLANVDYGVPLDNPASSFYMSLNRVDSHLNRIDYYPTTS
ncbi:hypothetical protein AB6A40_007612 [Gnathostoma spinigerum]|uniref:Uncharacterized protein n=1 Tax=Gnathostoma spinigerum TaxID=75299 RepID=A0ABD6ELQ7_9BILA